MSVNKVILLGNVGSDPRMHFPDKDNAFAFLSLATNERIGNAERTEWHNLVFMGEQARTAEKYIRKGTRLYVEGKLRTRQYQDKTGITRTITEIYIDYFELLGR